jgi:hypothetical protein
MSASSLSTAGILLIAIVAVEYGGVSLLRFITARTPGYLDNPVRQNLFRAGHAHAGVLVIPACSTSTRPACPRPARSWSAGG